jgi:hypothetical protein
MARSTTRCSATPGRQPRPTGRHQREIARDPVFLTVTPRRRNLVTDLVRDGLWIETDASRAKGHSAQFVPAWMLTLAWEYLLAHGTLTNRHLLATYGLNVERSSAGCTILARLPGIAVASTHPGTLEVASSRHSGPSHVTMTLPGLNRVATGGLYQVRARFS